MSGSGGSWDFTPVIELDEYLSDKPESISLPRSCSSGLDELSRTPLRSSEGVCINGFGLGNFEKIWEFLGETPQNISSSVSLQGFKTCHTIADDNNEAASVTKAVKWRDLEEGADLADIDELKPTGPAHLNKSQRKNVRRRVRKQEALEQGGTLKEGPGGGNASEPDSEKEIVPVEQSASRRRALIQEILHGVSGKNENVVPSLSTPTRAAYSSSPLPFPIASPRTPPSVTKRSVSAPPNAFAETASKKAALLGKLSNKFNEELQYLSSISLVHPPRDEDANLANGIHVFVDASNIMIGFHNALKASRKVGYIRRQPFSFHNLSLILERGRPIAKRVLAGSDNFPAITEAQLIGYECNILERVHKAKELTPRQKEYLNRNGTNGNISTSGSASETNAISTVTHAPEKWVEQAVDEILHLKILESVVDAKVPATMVLATGDAAEAEYSQGFLKMVTRALEKAWRVEVVSFRHNISGMYKRREFRARWGTHFKIIELDDYIEELLGV